MTTHNSQYSAETTHPDKQDSSPAPTAAGTTASNVSTTGNATTPDASIALNADATPVADVPPRLFGSFVEHLGRCVYGGIYEPSHPTADENGFRQDVLDLVKELGVTCVRYPGGNFVSNYNWEDGIGPRENRPVRRDLAWHCTETNEMGIDDFYRWSQKAGTEIMLAVNMGTRGLKAALEELEYVNGAPGTELADRRVRNGITEPMDIKMWCIGNEMDGPWQVGHMSPDEYAAAVDRVAHAMKLAESGLELVACGSSSAHMPTFGSWERSVLTKAYDNLDFVSCHAYYYERGAKSLQDYLASSQDMQTFISTVAACADEAKNAHTGDHDIALSFDEWGVWSMSDVQVQKSVEDAPWQTAPAISEQIYTMEDALLFASMLMNFIKRADRVKIACQSLLTNISSCIMTEKDGGVWVQPVYYPFALMAQYAHGVTLDTRYTGDTYACSTFETVPCVDHVLVYDGQKHEVTAFFVNRMEESAEATVSLQGMEPEAVLKSIALFHEDKKATNQKEHGCVTPVELENVSCSGNEISVELVPLSFQMVQIRLK